MYISPPLVQKKLYLERIRESIGKYQSDDDPDRLLEAVAPDIVKFLILIPLTWLLWITIKQYL